MPQHQAHPNFSHAEDPEYIIFHAPDPTVFRSEATDHTPIMWWHSEQRAAADAAGASYDLIEGPSPFGGWAELPASFEAMHIAALRSGPARSSCKCLFRADPQAPGVGCVYQDISLAWLGLDLLDFLTTAQR
jgi:hypothetical protein